mmetsp:Transcript_34970/g.66812  ORF Transcript_34970/g.66812 Transcript_34970/m.66812 type:complete len:394 (+) Transcript_34970:259-1440(+)
MVWGAGTPSLAIICAHTARPSPLWSPSTLPARVSTTTSLRKPCESHANLSFSPCDRRSRINSADSSADAIFMRILKWIICMRRWCARCCHICARSLTALCEGSGGRSAKRACSTPLRLSSRAHTTSPCWMSASVASLPITMARKPNPPSFLRNALKKARLGPPCAPRSSPGTSSSTITRRVAVSSTFIVAPVPSSSATTTPTACAAPSALPPLGTRDRALLTTPRTIPVTARKDPSASNPSTAEPPPWMNRRPSSPTPSVSNNDAAGPDFASGKSDATRVCVTAGRALPASCTTIRLEPSALSTTRQGALDVATTTIEAESGALAEAVRGTPCKLPSSRPTSSITTASRSGVSPTTVRWSRDALKTSLYRELPSKLVASRLSVMFAVSSFWPS